MCALTVYILHGGLYTVKKNDNKDHGDRVTCVKFEKQILSS